MADNCTMDSRICCFTDDSGAETLMIVCIILAATLLVTLLGLAWLLVRGLDGGKMISPQRKSSSPEASGSISRSTQGTQGNTSLSELTISGTPGSVVTTYNVKKPESSRSLKSSRGVNPLKSPSSLERQPQEKQPQRPHSARSYRSIGPARSSCSAGTESIARLRQLLEVERSRRMVAEASIGQRPPESPSSRSSIRKFPTMQTVEVQALEAASNAARWAHNATVVTHPADTELPSLLIGILAHTFIACHMEVHSRLNVRVDGMRAFIGCEESVVLGAPEGAMEGDTQELLYAELWRRFESIVSAERNELVALAARILSRSLPTELQRELGRRLVHRTWHTFEPLIRSYLAFFLRCALQRPPIEFEDTLLKEEKFNAEKHRELASFLEPEGSTCSVVFPATRCAENSEFGIDQSSDARKSGVVIWSSDYFRL